MAADWTFDPGLVFDDTTLTPSVSATGQLLTAAGGSVQTVYDLNGNPLTNNLLTTNSKGYVGRFKAGVPFGVISFGSVLQPVVAIEALQSGPQAAAAAASAAAAVTNSNTAAQQAAISAAAAQASAVAAQQAAAGGGGGGLPAGTTLETIPNGTTRLAMTLDERTKLQGVATGATNLQLGTTSTTAMRGNTTFTPAGIGAVQSMSGAVREWYRTAAQGFPSAAEGAADGDWLSMDAS